MSYQSRRFLLGSGPNFIDFLETATIDYKSINSEQSYEHAKNFLELSRQPGHCVACRSLCLQESCRRDYSKQPQFLESSSLGGHESDVGVDRRGAVARRREASVVARLLGRAHFKQ